MTEILSNDALGSSDEEVARLDAQSTSIEASPRLFGIARPAAKHQRIRVERAEALAHQPRPAVRGLLRIDLIDQDLEAPHVARKRPVMADSDYRRPSTCNAGAARPTRTRHSRKMTIDRLSRFQPMPLMKAAW